MKRFQELPVTDSNFELIRENNWLYVDKTQQILTLLSKGRYLFLSRPRRFGKSLLTTTLKALYEGKKELFKGLYIYDKWDWKEYPVIYLDFSNIEYRHTIAEFEQSLSYELDKIAHQYGITLTQISYLIKLNELVWKLKSKTGQRVVFLIDEYDKPITDFINNVKKAEENREFLKGFYAFLKGTQASITLVFVTGISKLAKISVFSGMNNMYDLSLTPELNDVVGLTEEDIRKYFVHHLPVLAQKMEKSEEEILAAIKYWYNGYSWDGVNKMYNPYSIIHLFDRMEFENYWYTSGLSSLLVNLILKESKSNKFKQHSDYYENVKVTKSVFDSADISSLSVEGLLFQTGYLTIKRIERDGFIKFYHLDYPNYAAKSAFKAFIGEKSFDELLTSESFVSSEYIPFLVKN